MPIIAESPPLIFGGKPVSPPTPTPKPRVTPTPTPRPRVTPTPTPVSQTGAAFVARHRRFIDIVDGLSACFKRDEVNEFTDQEFLDHSAVATMDKYIVQEKDMYCSMKGVQTLSRALERLGER